MKTISKVATIAILAGGTIFSSTAQAPDREKDLAATLAAEPTLSTFARLARASGLEQTLKRGGPYTLLAPTDEAFRMLPKGTLEDLMQPAKHRELADLVSYHILPGDFPSAGINTEEVTTLQGSKVILHREGGVIWVGRAEILKADLEASNGRVHVINMVLEPDAQ